MGRAEAMAEQAAAYARHAATEHETAHGFGVTAEVAISAAEAAWAQQDRFFRVVLSETISADVLGAIEAAGWALVTMSHVFIPRWTSTGGVGVGGGGVGVGVGGAATQGIVVGVYLFRRPT